MRQTLVPNRPKPFDCLIALATVKTGAFKALPIALLTLIPLGVIFYLALSSETNLWAHFARYVLPSVVGNTLLLMVCVAAGVLVVGVPLAWITAVCEFPGRRFFQWALVLPLAIPAYVLAFVQMGIFEFTGPVQTTARQLFGDGVWIPEIRGSFWGLVLVMVLAFYPYVYLLCRSAFATQGPRAMEAARCLGMGPYQAFFKAALPMAKPWVAGGLALVLMETLADFGAVVVFNHDTFSTALYKAWFDMHNLGTAAQLASVLILTVLAVFALELHAMRAQRFHVNNPNTARIPLKKSHALVCFGACAFLFAFAFAIPVIQLVVWATETWLAQLDRRYLEFTLNSLVLSILTAFIATTLALILAWIKRNNSDRQTLWVTRMANLGYALPGVVLAIGLYIPIAWLDEQLIGLLHPMGFDGVQLLKGTLATLLLALTARFMAVAFQSTDSSMQRITRNQEEVCASLGLGTVQTLRRLHFPLLRTGILVAFMMVAIDVMKEMPITLMTRQYGWDTLAVRVYQLTSESMWAEAATPALIIVGIGLLPVFYLMRQSTHQPNPMGKNSA
ncbi:ABC transporter permease [Limnobacter parvus]|uniref:Iron ABC transporter permease n=1 Tax=Limnobacter parvus TaxID=2939690 RepID=A0ABT1XE50_9BURK|nr:iron ABC transporter permease [Limnobacter parvus]MCR2745555.1 iron ABC transporter permease [Limnobacter parvus]